MIIPPTRDLCHALQLAAMRHGFVIRCDGSRLLLIAKTAAAGVLLGELVLVAGMWVTA